jgi:pre-mRNA-splicing factor SPF27
MIPFLVSHLSRLHYSPLTHASTDIDPEPTATERAAAEALIASELSPSTTTTTDHALLPPFPETNFSDLIQAEHARIEAKKPLTGGIDLTRYEALSAPEPTSNPSASDYSQLLARAYTSSRYLQNRVENLNALDTQAGKDAWLAGNEGLVSILQGLEKELAGTKEQIDRVVVERQSAQERVKGEVEVLESTWRAGVGRVLETEVAGEVLRGEILERRRRGV